MSHRQAKTAASIDPRHPALSEQRPLFIDNQGGNTLAQALAGHLEALRRQQAPLARTTRCSCEPSSPTGS